jgi:hypothetical protein
MVQKFSKKALGTTIESGMPASEDAVVVIAEDTDPGKIQLKAKNRNAIMQLQSLPAWRFILGSILV